MMRPSKDDLKRKFSEHRKTDEYKKEFNELMQLEFHEFMSEFLSFYNIVMENMLDEVENEDVSVEEKEWFYLYYGGELYSDVIKAHKWGERVDMALELIEKEQSM